MGRLGQCELLLRIILEILQERKERRTMTGRWASWSWEEETSDDSSPGQVTWSVVTNTKSSSNIYPQKFCQKKHFLVTNSEQLKIDKNFSTASGRLVNCVWRYIWEHLTLRFRSFNFMNPTIWLIKYFFVIYGAAQPGLTALFVIIKSLILSAHYGRPGDN